MKRAFAVALISALALFSADSKATVIATGTPVDGGGNAVAGGNVSPSGLISFYIPISGGYAGTYGVGGVGLSSGYFNGSGGPGSMDMLLKFSPTEGGSALRFFFTDLDLIGVNDPYGFLENVKIYNQDMSVLLADIDHKNDPGVVVANRTNQELLIDLGGLPSLGDPFIAKLLFTGGTGWRTRGYNTVEKVKATLITVSEPGGLLIFGIGLLGIGILVSRRDKAMG